MCAGRMPLAGNSAILFILRKPVRKAVGSAPSGPQRGRPAIRLEIEGATAADLVLGLRPEEIVVGERPFVAGIRLIEPHWHERIVGPGLAGGAVPTIRADAALPFVAGEAPRRSVRASRPSSFNAASGLRLAAAPVASQAVAA